jgi:hypothetical protein
MLQESFHKKIPTWDNGKWTYTEFNEKQDFIDFLLPLFKQPGEYEFDATALLFNEHATRFNKQGVYCMAPFKSKDFINYWDVEKEKCRQGVIFINEDKTWYLTRDYYFWINFLKIYNKVAKRFEFPSLMDVQYHMSMYELLAELHGKHASVFKKRQIASSYFHMAKMINMIWFEEGAILKMGASLKDYINLSGTWKFLEEYRDFLNENTAWYRPMNPGKVLEWQQKIEVTENGRKKSKGLKGMFTGMSFEQSPTKGVGGPVTYFFYEEAGVAPTMDKTFEYMLSALEMGDISTGTFIAAGSVGELKDAGPLKDMTLYPEANDIYPVVTNLIDDTGTVGKSGLFIPEQWGMPPYIDKYGNSLVKEAMAALDERRAEEKKKLDPAKYQLRISQRPRNIKEGFAFREEAIFPTHLVEDQERKIANKDYPYELIELDETADGKLKVKKTNKAPISTFPIRVNEENKEGSLVVWERPDKNPEFGQYIASIDPVGEGKTTTSESLCSIYVYKSPIEVTRTDENGVSTHIEGDKIVAAWCGRFDDINETHKKLRLIIEWYNAWTIVENNISLFIQYMIGEKKQKYLVPKNQMVFLKEAQANKTVYQEYGWRNTGILFKQHMLSYLIEWVKEVIDEDVNEEGLVLRKHYGISRIPDPMALKEMLAYQPGVNVDRIVSLAALISFVKVRQANGAKLARVENDLTKNLENSQDLYKLNRSAFRNIGKSRGSSMGGKKRKSAFKHIGRR